MTLTVAQVKSDPWKKGSRRPRRRFALWPEWFWKKIIPMTYDERCEAIGDMNELMYGKR